MKLNPDCIRDFLLAVESVCDMAHYFDFPENRCAITGEYSDDEILYHARQCELADMLYQYKSNIAGGFSVVDLSPKGHEFLANIREDSVWNSVKAVSAKVGSKSLSSLTQVATLVIAEIVKSTLGLT